MYIILEFVKAKIAFAPYQRWWKFNSGSDYKEVLDLTPLSLYNTSKIVYNLYQKYVNNGWQQLDDTSILFIQNMLLNKIYQVDSNGNVIPGHFLKPIHMGKSIAWGEDDHYIWDNNIDLDKYYRGISWYSWAKLQDTEEYKSKPPPDSPIWGQCSCFTLPGQEQCSPPDSLIPPIKNAYSDTGGFWPHNYGCVDFFDVPLKDSSVIGNYDLYEKPYDLYSYLPCVGKNMYIPGYPGARGSWAQLFADWGIVYSLRNSAGSSTVPVISDGLSCDKLYPCTDYCNNPGGTSGSCKITTDINECTYLSMPDNKPASYPKSDLNAWESSGINSDGTPGINFFSLYNIHPESFLITSWVAGYYNDSKVRKMIFDANAIPTLLGSAGGYDKLQGGWIRFLKAINTSRKSYDEIINELCREYASKNFPNLQAPPDPRCKIESDATKAFTLFQTIGAGFMAGPEFAVIGIPLAFGFMQPDLQDNCPTN